VARVDWLTVSAAGGRELEVLIEGDAEGFPLVFHDGTPTAAAPFPPLHRAADQLGLKVVTWSRPGYAASTRQQGRMVADVAADTAAVLDWLGDGEFVTLGWSGGGPHALAVAALLGGRCRAVATLASVAPYRARGLNWLAGMGVENVEEFGAAAAGPDQLVPYLQGFAAELATVTGNAVAAALGDLISAVDRAALTGELADTLAEVFRRAVSTGIDGWLDDDLAFVRDWGFDLAAIATPVTVWQGAQDRMVPFAHGQWLVDHIPGVRVRLLPDEGHISLVVQLDRILGDLVQQGSLPNRGSAI
jgi:pimeloyl-ACP methyl ester carboxylesterase